MNSTKGDMRPSKPQLWGELQEYYVIKTMVIFQNNSFVLVSSLLFFICYVFVWIGHWGQELVDHSSLHIITVIFVLANSLYVARVAYGIYFIRSICTDETTYHLLLKGDKADPKLKKIMNIFFLANLAILLILRFGEIMIYYREISIWFYYFPMAMFHDFVNAFTLTISLLLIISQQGILQLFMSQLRYNLASIFYDGKCFVSQEFLLESPFPPPPSHHFSKQLPQISSSQLNPVFDGTETTLDPELAKTTLFSSSPSAPSSSLPPLSSLPLSSSSSTSPSFTLSEYDIFMLFSQHYLNLHSSLHYLTVTYGKYLLFYIAAMLCTVVHLILYIYAYDGTSPLSSLIESFCSLYVMVILMFNLAKVNVFGRHVQTLITRKCIHLLTTLQSNPFIPTSYSPSLSLAPYNSPFLLSPPSTTSTIPISFSSSMSSSCSPIDPENPSRPTSLSSHQSSSERMIFYHQINGFISSLHMLKIFFGFTRYFALDYNGLSALLLSLILSMIPRLLSNHIQN